MTESVLLARLDFFGSEAKDERGGGETVRRTKLWFFGLGVVFGYYRRFEGKIELFI